MAKNNMQNTNRVSIVTLLEPSFSYGACNKNAILQCCLSGFQGL
jgi:hypothetical protein